jgi:hypothetical protein
MSSLDGWIASLPKPVGRMLFWARSWIFPPLPDSGAIETNRWAQSYTPNGNEDTYAVISKYAENQYESMVKLFDNLDKKADEQLRFMLTIVGAFTAAIASKLIEVKHFWLMFLALMPLLLAFLEAITAKTPFSVPAPMNPRDLLAITDLEVKPAKHQIECMLAVSYQVVLNELRGCIEWKARLLKRCTVFFVIGFLLILSSIIDL